MDKAHYIIFHPDSERENVTVSATIIKENDLIEKWTGKIYVDKINNGNEDPFVFNNPWLFSYCHASQLRQKNTSHSFLQSGSWLLFASGQSANNSLLTFDTVFLVGAVQKWQMNPLGLPTKYQTAYNDYTTNIWEKHFQFPFLGIHKSVKNTYEGELWENGKEKYSYLPLDITGQRVIISFSELPPSLFQKISKNVKGKYPVLLIDSEINEILRLINSKVKTKVIRDIIRDDTLSSKRRSQKC